MPQRKGLPSAVLAALPSALAVFSALEAPEPKRMLGMAPHTLLAVALMSCMPDFASEMGGQGEGSLGHYPLTCLSVHCMHTHDFARGMAYAIDLQSTRPPLGPIIRFSLYTRIATCKGLGQG